MYTLGVILFELLAHRLPYQLDQLPVHEVARVIREQEPSRLGSIDTLYRGDVEIIVGQGAGERQDAALRLGGGPGVGHQALPAGGSDPGPARVGALSAPQVRSAAQGAGGRGVGHLRGAPRGNRRFDRLCVVLRERSSADENARVANERERVATYQSYRARIAAAVAALSHHDVADAARQLDAAPEALRDWEWRHLHTRLDDSTPCSRQAPANLSS